MRYVAIQDDRELAVLNGSEPPLGPTEVRLKISYCGICGSDLHLRKMPEIFPAGSVPGHEASGTVTRVGTEVSDLRIGDRVCVNPFNYCGTCDECLTGNENHCSTAAQSGMGLGGDRMGAYAETVCVESSMCLPLPDTIDDRVAALAEPVAVGVHAVARSEVGEDQTVLVIGAGPIGAVTALVLRAEGFEAIRVVEKNPARRQLVADWGFEVSEEVAECSELAPAAIFECAGTPETAALAADIVPPRRRVILVGMPTRPLVLDGIKLVLNEIELVGSVAYSKADFTRALDLLVTGQISGELLISRIANLEDAARVFAELEGNTTDLKVLLKP